MWLLTVLSSTAELSKTLTGVFLPGTQAELVAGVPVLLLTPLKLRRAGDCDQKSVAGTLPATDFWRGKLRPETRCGE